jgi:2-haloacid dehalogenase
MSLALAFDVYGTLVDPLGMEHQLKALFGERGGAMSSLWRQKQLEYSFRRGLMECYENFDACTQRALQFTLRTFKVDLSEREQSQLLSDYLNLPAFPDALSALQALQASGYLLLAFSNGVENSLRTLLDRAGILPYLAGIVSVDPIKAFKPSPDVYAYLVGQAGSHREATWLVSANPFDIIGAKAAHLSAAWIHRNPEVIFDPWEFEPDIIVTSLSELGFELAEHSRQRNLSSRRHQIDGRGEPDRRVKGR